MATLLDWLDDRRKDVEQGLGNIGKIFGGGGTAPQRPQAPQPKPQYNFGTQTVTRPNAPGTARQDLGPLNIPRVQPIQKPSVPTVEAPNPVIKGIKDLTAASNEVFLGGAGRAAVNTVNQFATGFNQDEANRRNEAFLRHARQIDNQGNSLLASEADRNSTAFKVGQGIGTAQKVAADIATTALPGAAVEKVIRGTGLINRGVQAAQLPTRLASRVAPVVAGGAVSSAVNQVKNPEQDAGENFARGAAFDTAVGLAGPVASSVSRYLRNNAVQAGRNGLPSSLSPVANPRNLVRPQLNSPSQAITPPALPLRAGLSGTQRTADIPTREQVLPSGTQNTSTLSSRNPGQDSDMSGLAGENRTQKQITPPKSTVQSPAIGTTTQASPSQSLPVYTDSNVTYNPRTDQVAERGFVNSALANEELPVEMRALLENSKTPYKVRNTQELVSRAGNLVNDDPELARRIADMGNNDVAQALNIELLRKHQNEGNFEAAIDRIEDISRKATESGRATQVLAAYGRLTPEGALRFTQRQLSRFNEERGLIGKAKAAKLSPQQAEKITQLANKVQSLPDGLDKDRAIVELTQAMKTAAPTPLLQKLTSIWRAGLLTSLRTLEGGALGNTTKAVLDVPSQILASGVDKFVTAPLFNKGVRSNVFTLRGAGSGAAQGVRQAGTYLKTGIDPRDAQRGYDSQGINWQDGNPILGKVGQASDLVYRGLGAIDNPFYYSALGRANNEEAFIEASRRGLKGADARRFVEENANNLSTGSRDAVIQTAREAVFQNETVLGNFASKIKTIPQSIPNPTVRDAAQAVVDFTIPFAKIPGAVATALVDYSPAGVVLKTIQSIANKARGSDVNLRELNASIGKSATGSLGAVWLGNELYKRGLLTLEEPADEKERQLWASEGKQKFSIKLGDRWYNLNYVQPLGGLMALGGGYERAIQNGDPVPLVTAAGTGLKSVTEQSFLQGINDLIGLVEDPARNGNQFLNSKVSSFIPNIVRDTARATDNFERETNTITDAFNNSLPGLRQQSLPQRDPFGAPVQTRQSPTGVFLDPFKSTQAKNDEVTSELRRLYQVDPKEIGVVPTKLNKNQSFDGQDVQLTPEQLDRFESLAGPATYSQIYEAMTDPRYATLTDEERSKSISSVIEANRSAAKQVLAEEGDLKNKKDESVVVDPSDIKVTKASLKRSGENETYLDKYETALKEYEDDQADWSPVQRKKKTEALAKLTVQKDYDNDTVEMHGLSKEDVFDIASKEKGGEEMVKKLLAYDDALVAAGVLKANKFRDKYGNVSIEPKGKSSGGKKGGKGKAKKVDVKSQILPRTKVPTTSKAPNLGGGSAIAAAKLRPTQIRRRSGSRIPKTPSVRVRDGIA